MHFSLIKASDLVLVDSHGYVVEGGNQAMINEAGFMIHSEVHHARPEVMAVAHTHSLYGKTWSGFGKPIEMLTQGRPLSMDDSEPRIINKLFMIQMHAIFLGRLVCMKSTVVLHWLKKRDVPLQTRSVRTIWQLSCRTTGKVMTFTIFFLHWRPDRINTD